MYTSVPSSILAQPFLAQDLWPIACGIAAGPLLNYEQSIVAKRDDGIDHIISVVGWRTDAEAGKYWVVRNSWAEF